MARADISHLGLDISKVIDRRVYTDQVVYDTELERVFNKTWQFVAHVSELKGPGDFVSTSIANSRFWCAVTATSICGLSTTFALTVELC